MKTIQKKSGFTLLELMIVVAIISILASITVPNMGRWMADLRLKDAARELVSDMQWTKMTAIKENRDWAIIFNPPEGYTIQSSGDDGVIGLNTATGVNDDPAPAKTVDFTTSKNGVGYGKGEATTNATKGGGAFPSGYVSYSGNKVTFNSRGMIDGLPGYVYFSNNVGTAYAVATRTTAGVVSIKKWMGSSWD